MTVLGDVETTASSHLKKLLNTTLKMYFYLKSEFSVHVRMDISVQYTEDAVMFSGQMALRCRLRQT